MITVDLIPPSTGPTVRPAGRPAANLPPDGSPQRSPQGWPRRVSARSIREAVDAAGGPGKVLVLFPIDGEAFFSDPPPGAGISPAPADGPETSSSRALVGSALPGAARW